MSQKRVLTAILLIVACVVVLFILAAGIIDGAKTKPQSGTNVQGIKLDESKMPHSSLRLDISPVTPAKVEEVGVVVKVNNIGTIDVAWDREFAVFLKWSVKDKNGVELAPTLVSGFSEQEDNLNRRRFIVVKPGGVLVQQINLARTFRSLNEARGFRGGREEPIRWEESERYVVQKPTVIRVRLAYVPDDVIFRALFGYEYSEVGLPSRALESNEITIDFR